MSKTFTFIYENPSIQPAGPPQRAAVASNSTPTSDSKPVACVVDVFSKHADDPTKTSVINEIWGPAKVGLEKHYEVRTPYHATVRTDALMRD